MQICDHCLQQTLHISILSIYASIASGPLWASTVPEFLLDAEPDQVFHSDADPDPNHKMTRIHGDPDPERLTLTSYSLQNPQFWRDEATQCPYYEHILIDVAII